MNSENTQYNQQQLLRPCICFYVKYENQRKKNMKKYFLFVKCEYKKRLTFHTTNTIKIYVFHLQWMFEYFFFFASFRYIYSQFTYIIVALKWCRIYFVYTTHVSVYILRVVTPILLYCKYISCIYTCDDGSFLFVSTSFYLISFRKFQSLSLSAPNEPRRKKCDLLLVQALQM